MWVTRHSIVDWVWSKTQTLLATLTTQNQPRSESYVFLEAEHFFPQVGRVRSKRKYPTVLQSQKLFRWMLDWEWTDYLPWTCGMWQLKCYLNRNSTKSPKTKPAAGNCLRDPERDRTSKPKPKGNRDVDKLSHVDHVTTIAHSSQGESQLYMFKITKLWWRWSLWEEVRQWDTFQELTEFRWQGCLTEPIWTPRSKSFMLTPKTNSQDMLTTGNFTRDEWNHLHRLFHILNCPVFSCSRLSKFLSDPIRKQCAMSKRVQEGNLKEGSAVA